MECQHIYVASFFAVIICAHSAFGATIVIDPPAVEQGQDAVFRCTGDPLPPSPLYGWYDQTYNNGNPQQLFSGETSIVDGIPKFTNFGVSQGGAVMTITRALVEDEGQYACAIQGAVGDTLDFTVEVLSDLTMTLPSVPVVTGTTFEATCDVVNSRPKLNISWTLNGNALGVDPVDTNPDNDDPDLYNTRSIVTIPATTAMNGQTLKCTTSGHVVTSLNRNETTQLNVRYPPTSETANIVVEATKEGDTQLRVTCQVSAANNGVAAANPTINNYTIYAGSEQILSSTTENSVLVDIPDNDTDYKCSASNDLGTIESATVSYDPGQTTTQPTTTEPPTSEPPTTEEPDGGGLTIGATVGIVIGVLLFIALVVVLVVIFVLKPDCISGKGSGPPPKTMALQEQKPTNGNSEKVAPPTAAPRSSTVPHRNDNPGGAVYAEVQKGGRGYDQPDHTHPPQGDSGMNYATLDLSEEAGHTERQVPQNKDNVVVYSTILV